MEKRRKEGPNPKVSSLGGGPKACPQQGVHEGFQIDLVLSLRLRTGLAQKSFYGPEEAIFVSPS